MLQTKFPLPVSLSVGTWRPLGGRKITFIPPGTVIGAAIAFSSLTTLHVQGKALCGAFGPLDMFLAMERLDRARELGICYINSGHH